MLRKRYLCLHLISWPLSLFCQVPGYAAGSLAISSGGIGIMTSDVFCAANNIALSSRLEKRAIGFSYTNQYGVRDLHQISICAAIPSRNMGYGLNLQSYGNQAMTYQSFGSNIAHNFNSQFSAGLGFTYHLLNIAAYGHASYISTEMAIAGTINSKLSSSFAANNIFSSRIKSVEHESVHKNFRLGLQYQINSLVSLIGEIEKNNLFKSNLKLACQYQAKPKFKICFGLSTLEPQFTFGLSFKHKTYRIETACAIHQSLGTKSNFSLIFNFAQ